MVEKEFLMLFVFLQISIRDPCNRIVDLHQTRVREVDLIFIGVVQTWLIIVVFVWLLSERLMMSWSLLLEGST